MVVLGVIIMYDFRFYKALVYCELYDILMLSHILKMNLVWLIGVSPKNIMKDKSIILRSHIHKLLKIYKYIQFH